VTRLYDSFERAEQAVLELERAGIAQSDISPVSHQSDVKDAPAAVREPRDMTASEASGTGVAAGQRWAACSAPRRAASSAAVRAGSSAR